MPRVIGSPGGPAFYARKTIANDPGIDVDRLLMAGHCPTAIGGMRPTVQTRRSGISDSHSCEKVQISRTPAHPRCAVACRHVGVAKPPSSTRKRSSRVNHGTDRRGSSYAASPRGNVK